MVASDSGAVWVKALVVQLAILAGVVVFYKAYLPRMQKAQLAAAARAQEERIQAFVKSTIAEDPDREAAGTGTDGESLLHAQKLLRTLSLDETQQALGAPGSEFTDFREGQHLIWTGTTHRLEAVFDQGKLSILRFENLRTGHGVLVYASSAYWQAF
jgi:hypothetical protein